MSIEVKKESRDPALLMRKNIAPRISSLDLLRIVAMGMIISMHYLGHGGFVYSIGLYLLFFLMGVVVKHFCNISVQ